MLHEAKMRVELGALDLRTKKDLFRPSLGIFTHPKWIGISA